MKTWGNTSEEKAGWRWQSTARSCSKSQKGWGTCTKMGSTIAIWSPRTSCDPTKGRSSWRTSASAESSSTLLALTPNRLRRSGTAPSSSSSVFYTFIQDLSIMTVEWTSGQWAAFCTKWLKERCCSRATRKFPRSFAYLAWWALPIAPSGPVSRLSRTSR